MALARGMVSYLNQNSQDSEAIGFVYSHGNVGVLVRVEVYDVHL
jgi:hypothetical protein